MTHTGPPWDPEFNPCPFPDDIRAEQRLGENHIAVRFGDVGRAHRGGFCWKVSLDGEDVSKDVDEAFSGPAADDPRAASEFELGWVWLLHREGKHYHRVFGAVEIWTEPTETPEWAMMAGKED